MLEKQHNIIMNQRTRLRRKRRERVDEELKERVTDLIVQEMCTGPDSLSGPTRGVEHRKSCCLHRRTYVSPGPNFCWRMDGYDKLKPYGFSIHGCVDGLSRRILWLEVQRSNTNPRCVASYFVKHVEAAHGCPVRVYTDPGTENGLVARIQCYLRAEGLDEYAGSKSNKYVSSTKNQGIECQWSHYRKQRSSWWIHFCHDLRESDILDLTSDLHKEAIWFCFADLL